MTDRPLTPEREQEIREDTRHVFVGSLSGIKPGAPHCADCFGCERDDLLAEIDRLRADLATAERERDEARQEAKDRTHWSLPLIKARSELDAARADLATAQEALRENVRNSYLLLTQGELPGQRRGPNARAIYDRSREALDRIGEQ